MQIIRFCQMRERKCRRISSVIFVVGQSHVSITSRDISCDISRDVMIMYKKIIRAVGFPPALEKWRWQCLRRHFLSRVTDVTFLLVEIREKIPEEIRPLVWQDRWRYRHYFLGLRTSDSARDKFYLFKNYKSWNLCFTYMHAWTMAV